MPPISEKIASSSHLHDNLHSSDESKMNHHNATTNGTSRNMAQQRSSTRHLPSNDDAHPTAQKQKARRRATAYTAQYTPSPHMQPAAANRHDALDEQIEKRRSEKEMERREEMKRQQQQGGMMRRVSLQEERGRVDEDRARLAREHSRRKSTNEEAKSSSQPTRRASSFHASSHSQVTSPRTNKSSDNKRSQDSNEMTEEQIAEYAGKRAMLRLEQEFTDAHNDRKTSSSFHSVTSMNSYVSVMDRRKLSRVPQVSKSDLIIGEYLGRGNFCDVFEVEWAMKNSLTGERLSRNESFDDDSMASDEDEEDATRRKMEYLSLVCSNDIRPEIIGTNKRGEIDADAPIIGSRRLRGSFSQVHTGPLLNSSARNLRDPNVMALKCLRPAVRAQPRKFVIGAEDLAHETALLSCLDHPNIIKIYGRAKGSFATAFQFGSSKVSVSSGGSVGRKKERSMNDGYFIILDKLTATLDGTIGDWKDEYDGLSERLHLNIPLPLNVAPPECNLIEHLAKRIKVAYSIASALEYLHSRHVVFRDLKPANVGFDCNDCVKMFDFGFATSIAPLLNEQIRSGREQKGYGPLTETCGTRRYMAPEVALKLGYGKEVDVYSFGMLLWEICAMEKPFDSIQSVDDFHDLVVLCGNRPPLNDDPLWTKSLKQLMSRCWSTDPYDRPDMSQVKSMLCVVLRDMNIATMKLKKLRADQARSSSFKRDESSRSSRSSQTPPREPQQQPAGFLNKFRRRASIA